MEKTLFPLIKNYLEAHQFEVKAEVMDIDIVAKHDDLVIAVEMKTSLNTKLIYQGIKRTHITDYVYLAIPKPSDRVLKSANFKEKKTIIRRLELGLMFVDITNNLVSIVLDPKHYHFRKQKKKKRKLLKEFNQRKTAYNIGGTHNKKIITAYRELALLALDYLKDDPKTTKALRTYTKRKKVVRLLQDNYYGWFDRVERGVYKITPLGKDALETYQEVIIKLKKHHNKAEL
ncbi:MAG: hypothetical protein K9L74_00165 [Candidatus Izimaplasma sp.]|nr:hypothetical protein [Candidatus Izimaplasma bacterium]